MALLSLCFSTAILASGFVQDGQHSSSLDAYLDGLIHKHAMPSASVAIVKNGRVTYAKAFGYSDLENDVKATPDSVYRLGSITKQFTATMIMQLVNEGKLNIDQPIREILPGCPDTWMAVTTRNLLNHTSGIKSYTEISGIFADAAMKPTTPSGIIKTIEKSPLDFEPGTKWHYDNTGYELLGMIIEKLDHLPFAVSLSKRILKPLGMTHTYFTSEQNIVKHRAQGYSPVVGGFKHANYLNMSWPYAAGSMESTVLDLAKWDAALYGSKLLPQDSLAKMWTPTTLKDGTTQNYGFGWALATVNGSKCVEHGGGIHGFTTYIKRAPQKGLTVILLTNSDESDTNKIANDLMGIADPSLQVKAFQPIANNDTLTKLTREAITSMIDGTLNHKLLTPDFAKQVTPEIESSAKADLGKLGKLTKMELLSTKVDNGMTTREYRITIGVSELKMTIAITKEGLIAGLRLSP